MFWKNCNSHLIRLVLPTPLGPASTTTSDSCCMSMSFRGVTFVAWIALMRIGDHSLSWTSETMRARRRLHAPVPYLISSKRSIVGDLDEWIWGIRCTNTLRRCESERRTFQDLQLSGCEARRLIICPPHHAQRIRLQKRFNVGKKETAGGTFGGLGIESGNHPSNTFGFGRHRQDPSV